MYAAYKNQRLSWLLLVVVLFAALGSSTASPQPTAENTASDVNGRRYGHSDEYYPKVHKGRDRIRFWELLLNNPGGAPSPVRPTLPTPETKCDSLPAAPANSNGWECGENDKREHPTFTPGTTCTATCRFALCNGGRGTCNKQQRALIDPASFTITCENDGTWTPRPPDTLDCPAPAGCGLIDLPQPLNAGSWVCPSTDATQLDDTVCTATCNDECSKKRIQPLVTVVCEVTTTCVEGSWSQPEGTCPVPAQGCLRSELPNTPANTVSWDCPSADATQLEGGSVCTAECTDSECFKKRIQPLDTLVCAVVITCTDGVWIQQEGTCPNNEEIEDKIPINKGPVGGPAAN